MVPWGDVPSPGNWAREAPKSASQPRLLGLRCWREEAEAWITQQHLQAMQEFTPENAAVTGKSFLCPPLLILSHKNAVPCREP